MGVVDGNAVLTQPLERPLRACGGGTKKNKKSRKDTEETKGTKDRKARKGAHMVAAVVTLLEVRVGRGRCRGFENKEAGSRDPALGMSSQVSGLPAYQPSR